MMRTGTVLRYLKKLTILNFKSAIKRQSRFYFNTPRHSIFESTAKSFGAMKPWGVVSDVEAEGLVAQGMKSGQWTGGSGKSGKVAMTGQADAAVGLVANRCNDF